MAQLVKASLRMRPDRILIGEVRGKEVMDMIQALNTGHSGSLGAGHANSIEGMLNTSWKPCSCRQWKCR